jgi:dephospho-CoA kinase
VARMRSLSYVRGMELFALSSSVTGNKIVVGICGKACAGKDQVVQQFAQAGFFVVDADKLGIEALTVRFEELIRVFGTHILNAEGHIDRTLLGARVFSNAHDLVALNAISHPYIKERITAIIAASSQRYIVINAALLPLIKVEPISCVVWVVAPLITRIKRALKRDQRSLRFVMQRIWAQRRLSVNLYYQRVDRYKIENRSDLAHLQQKSDELIVHIKGVYDA